MREHPAPYAVVLITLLVTCLAVPVMAENTHPGDGGVFFAVSPLFGWDRNKLKIRGPMGQEMTETDTAPMYGLFAIVGHPNLVVNNFLFFTDVNDTDVLGDLVFANYYADAEADATWNAGVGYLYHKIDPENEEINVHVPMVKLGPLFRFKDWHLSVNPYIGYAWEQVDTQHGDQDNDSYLYGISLKWRWRMVSTALKYYFQDSQEVDEDFHTFRCRLNASLTENWGFAARVDYMEHQTTEDTSVLFGPSCVF
jgi:hypothetical protein